MEAEAAGVAWPQLHMRPAQSQGNAQFDSDSENEPNTSQVQSSSKDNESRKIFNAEKRKRKAERAALRAESRARKQARKSARESLLVKDKEAVLVPPSSAPSRPTLSFPEVSTSPVDDDEKEEDEPTTQSIETEEPQPSAPTVESEQQTESQDSTSTQQSPSPSRLPVNQSLGSKQAGEARGKVVEQPEADEPLSDNESSRQSPSTRNTSGSSELDSSIPEQADLEIAIKAVPPKRPNAEAGPSVKKPKIKPATSTPVTPRTTKKRTRESGVSQRASPKVEDDESLRRRLSNPSAVAEFIASKYWAPPYLNRLEAAGIISLKKGKLSVQELDAVKRHLEIFMRTNRLDEEQLAEIIMSRARGGSGDRESYPSFWQDLAIQIPGRPLRYVVKQIQRMYDPRARKGPWSAKEDADLKRAHEIHPGMWTKIAAIIDRTEQDCRDRYSKEIVNTEKRNTGTWTLHEEDLLREAVKEANRAIGNTSLSLEAPWEIISAKLDHKRGPTQCRVKWHRDLYPRMVGTAISPSARPTKPKPLHPQSLQAKRASEASQPTSTSKTSKSRKSPVVVLKKGKTNASQYKSQDIISDSGSDGEDEKRDA